MAKFEDMGFYEFIYAMQRLNPNTEIRISNPDLDSACYDRIFCSVPVEKLVFPEGFYYSEKNGITNKYQTATGVYHGFDCKPIEGNEDILQPFGAKKEIGVLGKIKSALGRVKDKLGDVKDRLSGKEQEQLYKTDADRFYKVDGEFKGLPEKYDSNSVSYFTKSGNVYILTVNKDGTVNFEDLRSGDKKIYQRENILMFPLYDEKGNMEGSRLGTIDGALSSTVKGFFVGDIRQHYSASQGLMGKVLETVNPGLVTHAFGPDQEDNQYFSSVDQLSINRHPEDLIVPECFGIKSNFENDTHSIRNKHLTSSGMYVDYSLTGFPQKQGFGI